MLVLTRKIGERILVPQCQLSVTVLEITASRVRLGVSAPAEVAVHREEVEKRIS
jgi:carbon storage regulator